jgi:hypothetical protein
MDLQHRCAELLAPDARLRLAIYSRSDQRFQIVEERVQSYETGDEWHPVTVPFPSDASWQPHWIIDTQRRDGLYGTVEDALNEAKHLLADGS